MQYEQTTKNKILHIDSSGQCLEQFRAMYKSSFSVISKTCGKDALDVLQDEQINTILVGSDLEDMSGLKFINMLRKNYPDLPVIFLTDNGNKEIVSQVFKLGASDYITKDFDSEILKEKLLHSINCAISRYKAEEELRRERAFFNDFKQLNPYAISIWNTDGYFVSGNKAFYELFKITPELEPKINDIPLFENKVLIEYGIFDLREKIKKENSITFGPIFYNSRSMGEEYPDNPIYVKVVALKILDSNNEIENYVLMFENMTDRVAAQNELKNTLGELEEKIKIRTAELEKSNRQFLDEQEKLKKEQVLFNNLIQFNPYAISIWDAEGYFISGNRAYYDLFKIPPEHTDILRAIPLFENPILVNAGVRDLRQRIKDESYVVMDPIFYNSRVGGPEYPDNPIYISAVALKLLDSNGEIENYIIMYENITERVIAQNELKKTLEGLEERVKVRTAELAQSNKQLLEEIGWRRRLEEELTLKNKELEEFALRVGHDLKNSIIAFSRIADIVKRDPSQIEDVISLLFDNSKKLTFFIEQLLELARAGRVISEVQPVLIEPIVKQIFQNMKPFEVNGEIKVQKSFPPILCDPLAIEQVFLNLIGNSIQYLDPEKDSIKIDLKHRISNDKIHIIYSDNGMGMDPKIEHQIFNVLFTTNPTEHYGLGLSIVKKIIEAHNGIIKVKNKGSRKGIEFTMSLPY